MYQDSEATALLLENEKIEVLKNLENMTSLYSEANADNEVANEKLIEAQTRLDSLMKELKTSKLTVSALLKYKRKYFEMESEMEVLLEENATLKFQNTLLETSLDSTQVQLSTQVASNTKLEAQNQRLSESVEAAKKLTVERLNPYGVIQRRSGKLVPTTRASRVDNLRICYSVPSNVLTASGDKNYLVQVIDPNLNVIGSNTPVQFEETILKYSYVSAFTYDNELLDVCDFVSAEEGDYEKGVYTVNVFDQQTLVASSTFTLK
jgi:actin-related protein